MASELAHLAADSDAESADKPASVVFASDQHLRGEENYSQWEKLMKASFRFYNLDDLLERRSPFPKGLEEYERKLKQVEELEIRTEIFERGDASQADWDALDAIERRESPTPETVAAYKSERKRYRQLFNLLKENIDPTLFHRLTRQIFTQHNMEDPVLIWKRMENAFGDNPDATSSASRQMMQITTKEDFTLENVMRLLERYKDSYAIYIGGLFPEDSASSLGKQEERIVALSEQCALAFVTKMRLASPSLIEFGDVLSTWNNEDMDTLPRKLRRFVRRMEDIRVARLAEEENGGAGRAEEGAAEVVNEKKSKKKGNKRGKRRGGAKRV